MEAWPGRRGVIEWIDLDHPRERKEELPRTFVIYALTWSVKFVKSVERRLKAMKKDQTR